MAHRPNHPLIIVVNADGSGYVRQYDTLSEAKDAFKTITTDGVAYLYPPAKKSLSSKPAGSPAPIASTPSPSGDQKAMDFNPFQNSGWATIVNEYFDHCELANYTDAEGKVIQIPIARYNQVIYSNGQTSVERKYELDAMPPCYIPEGVLLNDAISERFDEFDTQVKTISSLDYGGNVFGPYYEVTLLLNAKRWYKVADGEGGIKPDELEKNGIMIFQNFVTNWENYSTGDIPYKFPQSEGNRAGYPIPNGRYLVTYKVEGDERIHSGAWRVQIDNATLGSISTKWTFEPDDPTQPPPPPCSITKKVQNPISGNLEDVCDDSINYPFNVTEDCEPPVTVQIEGQTFTLGTNTRTGMDDGYGNVTWGECSGMVYLPYGSEFAVIGNYGYFSDGNGSYFTQSNCPPQGQLIGEEQRTDITVNINGSTYTVGYSYERTIADGNCGSGIETGSEYQPYGTFIISDADYNYYSDGAGSYYSSAINNYPPYGTLLNQSVADISVYVSEIGQNVVVGSSYDNEYADGNGGSYHDQGNNYTPYGQLITFQNDYNIYSNGSGSYYSEFTGNNGGGGGYPSYGTELYSDGGNSTVNLGCGDWVVGSWGCTYYADGNGGSYSQCGGYNVPNGTFLGNCNDYNYYSNGSGGYYQGEYTGTPCPPYGQPTGFGDSGINFIEINGQQYENGTYSYTEYADGSCGTYTSYSYYYKSYGEAIVSIVTGYDEMTMTDIYTTYYSDGNGGYFT